MSVCASRGKTAPKVLKDAQTLGLQNEFTQIMASLGSLKAKPTATPTTTTHPTPDVLVQKTLTIRKPPFSYLHLTLLAPATTVFDLLTARAHLTSALNQFLGVTGTAIPVDFLKIEGRDVWVRVPREDGAAVVGAISSWVGGEGVAWWIREKGDWLGAVVAGGGRRIFEED